MNDRTIDRRQFLKLTGLAALGAASACAASGPRSTPALSKIGQHTLSHIKSTQTSQPSSTATQTTQPTSTATQTTQPSSPNIRLCLSGHTHQHESLEYLGVRYLTDGAVCGNWWEGAFMDFPPAYVLVDLYDDGSVDRQFVPYDES